MCLIIDSNVVDLALFLRHRDFAPIVDALTSGRARLVFGGKLKREYRKKEKLWRFLVSLEKAGRARPIDDQAVDAETGAVQALGVCVSDDPHIVALARLSGARLLCSLDCDLAIDFKNRRLLRPRGSVYKEPSHRHLLRRHCSGIR